jgi:hypothetical protein
VAKLAARSYSEKRVKSAFAKVWASIAGAAEFLQHLKVKAGLPPEFWSAVTCDEFAEPDDRPARLEAS